MSRREYLIVNPGGNRVERGASGGASTRRASDPAALAAAVAGIPTTLKGLQARKHAAMLTTCSSMRGVRASTSVVEPAR
jgi:hypothetical protein